MVKLLHSQPRGPCHFWAHSLRCPHSTISQYHSPLIFFHFCLKCQKAEKIWWPHYISWGKNWNIPSLLLSFSKSLQFHELRVCNFSSWSWRKSDPSAKILSISLLHTPSTEAYWSEKNRRMHMPIKYVQACRSYQVSFYIQEVELFKES